MTFPILTAAEAASLIDNGQTVGFSGFTPAGAPKAIPLAIAERAIAAHNAGQEFQIGVLTGASTGPSLDGALAKAKAMRFRTPYQTNADLRDRINAGKTRFFDLHLSLMPQVTRYGFLGPVDVAVVEAADLTAGGGIVLHLRRGRGAHLLQPGRKGHHRAESASSGSHPGHARYLRAGKTRPIASRFRSTRLRTASARRSSPSIRPRSWAWWKRTWRTKPAASARSAR